HRLHFDQVDPGAVAAAGHDLAALPAPEGQGDRTGVDPVPQPLLEPHAPTVLTAQRSASRSASGWPARHLPGESSPTTTGTATRRGHCLSSAACRAAAR